MPATRYCAHCAEPFVLNVRGRHKRFCSTECRHTARNVERVGEYTSPIIELRDCEVCGEQYAPRQRNQRNCSRQCYENRVRPPHRRVVEQRRCDWCADAFDVWSDYREQTYCSKSCALQSRRKTSCSIFGRSCRVFVTQCVVCERHYTAKVEQRVGVCSQTCRNRLKRWGQEGLDEIVTCRECGAQGKRRYLPNWHGYCSRECAARSNRRIGKQRRSRRIQMAPHRETVDIRVLAERDNWRCHICKHPVSRTSWSVDHLVPLSAGGDHTYANTALAHHRCNTLRGVGEAQLRLAG